VSNLLGLVTIGAMIFYRGNCNAPYEVSVLLIIVG